jgi:hypothetical protein
MRSAVVKIIENQGRCTWERRRAGDSKLPSPMRAAECFLPLPVIKDVESVRKHETGLECDQRLPRKLRITVLTQQREERRPASKVAVSDLLYLKTYLGHNFKHFEDEYRVYYHYYRQLNGERKKSICLVLDLLLVATFSVTC